MTIYLGPLGNLQALPSVGRGISATITTPTVVHQLAGAGGRVVDHPGVPKRTYAFPWGWLSTDEMAVVEALYLGAFGRGPFVLIEPWRRNYLSANQSSGTDVLMDTTGAMAVTGTITSSTAQAAHGARSLAWAVTAANQRVALGNLANITAADPNTDTPVLPSTAYTGQVKARLSASTGTVRLDVSWFTELGVFISTSTGTAVAQSNSAFGSALTVTATSPSTADIARLSVTNTVMGAAQTIYLDQFQFELGSSASAWAVGTGVPRVSFDADLGETYNVTPYADLTVSLIEV